MLRKLCISLLVVVCFFSTPSYAKELMVNVGIAMDQTGPLATSGRKGVSSWQWFEEYLNKEVGGWKDVAGNTVKLKVLYGDTGFTPAKTISLYKKFKDEKIVAFGCMGSVELGSVRAMLLEDKIPAATNSGSLIYPLPSPAFGHWADYTAVSAAVIDYVKDKWEKSKAPWTKKRPPRLAFIGPEGYPSWAAAVPPEVMRYAKLKGVEVAGKFFIPMNPIDTKPQVLSAKGAKTDFIYTGVVVSQAGAVFRDLYDLGLKGDPTKEEGKIECIVMFPVGESELIAYVGGKVEPVQEVIIIGSHEDPWADKPTLKRVRDIATKQGVTKEFDHNYVHEWYAAMRTGEAIRLALQKTPGDKLKGSDVWEGFLKIKGFDTGGVFPNLVTLSEENRLGMNKVRVDKLVVNRRHLVTNTDYKMLAPLYTKEYAMSHGKKSIYSDETLKILNLTSEKVGYEPIKD